MLEFEFVLEFKDQKSPKINVSAIFFCWSFAHDCNCISLILAQFSMLVKYYLPQSNYHSPNPFIRTGRTCYLYYPPSASVPVCLYIRLNRSRSMLYIFAPLDTLNYSTTLCCQPFCPPKYPQLSTSSCQSFVFLGTQMSKLWLLLGRMLREELYDKSFC